MARSTTEIVCWRDKAGQARNRASKAPQGRDYPESVSQSRNCIHFPTSFLADWVVSSLARARNEPLACPYLSLVPRPRHAYATSTARLRHAS